MGKRGIHLNVQAFTDWLESHQRQSAWTSLGFAAVIALADWRVGANVSLGALYIFAIILGSLSMRRTGIILFAAGCSVLREALGPYHWQPAYGVRLALVGGALGGMGMLIAELNRNRKLVIENLHQREQHLIAEQESEKQLATLVNTSPLPILVAGADGKIMVANEASGLLLEGSNHSSTASVFEYLPELKAVLDSEPDNGPVRREIECAGRKRSGESFFAHVWLTAYRAKEGRRIAVVLWDASEDLRGREIATAGSINTTSRVLLAGFAHEVRNLASAANSLCERLGAGRADGQEDTFTALTGALQSLSELAGAGLRLQAGQQSAVLDLSTAMEQIRIVLQPMLDTAGVQVVWNIKDRLPRVYADHSTLIQVFLNLASNSERATAGMPDRRFQVEARSDANGAIIRVADNGPGVANPEQLFEPFRSGAGGAGLGLYISRAMLRSCGGDLGYERGLGSNLDGACFYIQLQPVTQG